MGGGGGELRVDKWRKVLLWYGHSRLLSQQTLLEVRVRLVSVVTDNSEGAIHRDTCNHCPYLYMYMWVNTYTMYMHVATGIYRGN